MYVISNMAVRAALKTQVVEIFKAFGLRLSTRRSMHHHLDRRERLLRSHRVDLVLDVGANIGQYGQSIRRMGYRERIISFEPMRNALETLKKVAQRDGNWEVLPIGLGDKRESCNLHISKNSISSSVLPMLSSHETFSPQSYKVGVENIEIRRLDDVYPELKRTAKRVWLKVDVQGFEDRVFKGGEAALASIDFVQVELSLRPLYESQWLYMETIEYLRNRGFHLISVEPGFSDKATGELLQMDGIFVRPDRAHR